jgi:PAS domain S-box-containing protein
MMDDGSSVQAARLRDGLRLVSSVTQAFAEPASDYRKVLDTVVRHIAEAIPNACCVMLRDGDAVSLAALYDVDDATPGTVSELVDRKRALHDAPVSAAVLAHGPMFVPRIDFAALARQMSPASVERLRTAHATGLLVVPLVTRRETVGVLWLIRRGDTRPALDDIDLEICKDLASHIALAISNARLFKQLERSEQLRLAEERAVAASSLLDAIVENIPDMVFVKDADRLAFVRFNRAGEELLGLARDQLIGKTDFDLFPPSEAEFFVAKDRETLQASAMVEITEEPIQTQYGKRWLHTKKVPLRDAAGVPRYLLGISHDITERKQAIAELSAAKANAEQAMKELESFSYSMAHDLRTPLRAIDGFSQALVEDYGARLDAEGLRYLRRVREAAQRMAELIDDLLTLSRVTRSELKRARVDLSALARTLLAGLARCDPERQVEIVIAPGVFADADPQLAAIALDNLLGNAWKFTARCPIARIELGQLAGGDGVTYFVRDNGAGFDMAFRDKLFGVFQRLHPEVEFPGTGIGLATVARITERHRGRIWADSVPGQGATFFFTLTEPHA